jgi:hypothetical protein
MLLIGPPPAKAYKNPITAAASIKAHIFVNILMDMSEVKKFNDIWWDEVKNFSARDQLSQVYSSWKTDVKISPIPIGSSIYINKYLNAKIKHPKKWLV